MSATSMATSAGTTVQRFALRSQLIFVDGTWADQAQELADYIQVGEKVKPLLEQEKNNEALKTIVDSSIYLNSVPEKEFTAAYNLLIYVVLQAKEPQRYLPAVCQNLLKPITSSPSHGFTLASNAFTTMFNLLDDCNPVRMRVFMQILRFVKQQSQWDVFKPALKNLDLWLKDWSADEEDSRSVYVEVADAAGEGHDEEESYHYLIKALQTFDREDQEEITSEEAKKLSLRALRMAINSPTRFDFQDLRLLPTVQALSDSHPVHCQLLDVFAEQDLEDYNDFNEEHENWIETEKLNHERLQRKMRLLTFASLAASSPNREIPYDRIQKSLMIPEQDVEMWTIDVIRAGLVEGRLSQQKRVFLVHRTTYRVFGEKQWRELGTRVDQFKNVVDKLIVVIRRQHAEVATQRERDRQEIERKLAGAGLNDGGRQGGDEQRDRRRQGYQKQQRLDDDE